MLSLTNLGSKVLIFKYGGVKCKNTTKIEDVKHIYPKKIVGVLHCMNILCKTKRKTTFSNNYTFLIVKCVFLENEFQFGFIFAEFYFSFIYLFFTKFRLHKLYMDYESYYY